MKTASAEPRSTRAPATRAAGAACAAGPWWRRPLALSAIGCLLLWAALPPLAWSALAWLAPVPWVLLIREPQLVGRRPYVAIWLASLVFWLAALYWLTLPHWATAFGWLALCAYLAIYLPLFIGLSRVAVQRLRVPAVVAAPVVYVGLELARAHLLSGFAMAGIAHTQVGWPALLQIGDTFGAYGVSFVMVMVAAAIASAMSWAGRHGAWWPVLPAGAALGLALAYGYWRLEQAPTAPGPKVALIQGSIDITMKQDPEMAQRIFDQYFQLSLEAVRKHRDLDLIVWPETMFRGRWYTFEDGLAKSAHATDPPAEIAAGSRRLVEMTAEELQRPCLFGIDSVHETADGKLHYRNSGLFVDERGGVVGRYDKCHLVPFGEFVPFATWFPWLYRLTPLSVGLERGDGPVAVEVGGVRYAANICYENTVPQFVRRQVKQLRAAGQEPDVLVNLTNDGWFWGSTELDMHLACGVFRAIECRKPFLIAANTGFSAWIDSSGRLLAKGRRRQTDLIVAAPAVDFRRAPYLAAGDWAAGACLAATIALAVIGVWPWARRKPTQNSPSS